jgi:GTP-binding protein
VTTFAIAAAAGQGLPPLLYAVVELLRAHPKPEPEPATERIVGGQAELDERMWRVERVSAHHWRVSGGRIERLVRMTDFANEEAAARLQRVLAMSGVSSRLLKEGVAPGDVVHIAERELIWDEEAYEAEQARRIAEQQGDDGSGRRGSREAGRQGRRTAAERRSGVRRG